MIATAECFFLAYLDPFWQFTSLIYLEKPLQNENTRSDNQLTQIRFISKVHHTRVNNLLRYVITLSANTMIP